MYWQNTETPTFAGNAGSDNAPVIVERINLRDRNNNVVAYFDKNVDGTTGFYVGGVQVTVDAELMAFTDAFTPASASGPSSFAFAEDTDNGVNTVTVIAPASVASDAVATLPGTTGTLALTSAIPVKASGAEVNTGTDDAKFVTAKAVEDSDYAKVAAITITQAQSNSSITPCADGTVSPVTSITTVKGIITAIS